MSERDQQAHLLRTRDFALSETDAPVPGRVADKPERPGTIHVRVSPFVYSAWGFGVLMPKPKSTIEDEDVWTEF